MCKKWHTHMQKHAHLYAKICTLVLIIVQNIAYYKTVAPMSSGSHV